MKKNEEKTKIEQLEKIIDQQNAQIESLRQSVKNSGINYESLRQSYLELDKSSIKKEEAAAMIGVAIANFSKIK